MLALSGAVAYVEDRHPDLQQDAAAALKINPRFSDAYRVPAELAAGNYRFEEAVVLSRKALEIDPNDVRTLSALGVQLLRTGDEAEARQVLEKSFAIDKFDKTTFNLLTMLDSLDKFDTTTDGNIVVQEPSERNGRHARVRGAAGPAGAGDLLGEVQVHADRGRS